MSNANNYQNISKIERIFSLMALNAIEQEIHRAGLKTRRANPSLRKKEEFYAACGRNKLPLRQIPELVAEFEDGAVTCGLQFKLDANEGVASVNITLAEAGHEDRYISKRFQGGSGQWAVASLWNSKGLSFETKLRLQTLLDEFSLLALEKLDHLELEEGAAEGTLRYNKI